MRRRRMNAYEGALRALLRAPDGSPRNGVADTPQKETGMGAGDDVKGATQALVASLMLSQVSERERAAGLESQLEKLRNAEMIDENASTDQVGLGTTVEVTAERKTRTYMIVGSTEADPSGEPPKISNVSPLGASLLGKKIGEKVQVTLPNGENVTYTIKKIS